MHPIEPLKYRAAAEGGGKRITWVLEELLSKPLGHTPSTAGTFRKKFRKKFRKDTGNALRAFPGIPVESTAGMPQTLQFKAFEASRAFPELSPPQYGWGRLFFQKWFRRGPLRAGHGIPSSTGGISEPHSWRPSKIGIGLVSASYL